MPSIEYDLRYIEAGLLDIEGYLLSKELYWPVGATAPSGEPPYPRLTLGNLLLALARLSACSLTGDQQAKVDRLKDKIESTKSRWATAWEQKAEREYQARLNLWRDYLEEYRRDPGNNVDRYTYESRRRAILHLLSQELKQIPPNQEEMLRGLDALLNAVLIPGDFIWERDLEPAFPVKTYWYLYGKPQKR